MKDLSVYVPALEPLLLGVEPSADALRAAWPSSSLKGLRSFGRLG